MLTHIKKVKELPVKIVKKVVLPIIPTLIKKETKPKVFSKEWEWDQMCNHCVD